MCAYMCVQEKTVLNLIITKEWFSLFPKTNLFSLFDVKLLLVLLAAIDKVRISQVAKEN